MITKSFAQDGRTCRVTFRLSAPAESAALLGDFNLWDAAANPLERDGEGTLCATVALEPGRRYRFRYLLDGERWLNDDGADDWAPNQFGTFDSVVAVAAEAPPAGEAATISEPAATESGFKRQRAPAKTPRPARPKAAAQKETSGASAKPKATAAKAAKARKTAKPPKRAE